MGTFPLSRKRKRDQQPDFSHFYNNLFCNLYVSFHSIFLKCFKIYKYDENIEQVFKNLQ